MPNNLIISYDLYKPSQSFFMVETAIKSLGSAIKVHQALWYVNSLATVQEAKEAIMAVMDANDTLFVVDASNNSVASHNARQEVEQFIQANWPASLSGQGFSDLGLKPGNTKRMGR
jgi:hypothetical protein